MDVGDVVAVLDRVEADLVSRAVDEAAPDLIPSFVTFVSFCSNLYSTPSCSPKATIGEIHSLIGLRGNDLY